VVNLVQSSLSTLYAVSAVVFLLYVTTAPPAFAEPERRPGQVEALRAAMNAYDVETSVDLFTDDAVLIQPRLGGMPQVYVGHEQIRWWLRSLFAQHAHFDVPDSPERAVGHDVRWTERFSIDVFRQVDVDAVDLESEAVLAPDGRFDSLTTVLTPGAARTLQGGVQMPSGAVDQPDPGARTMEVVLVCVGFAGGALTMLTLTRFHPSSTVQDDARFAAAAAITGNRR